MMLEAVAGVFGWGETAVDLEGYPTLRIRVLGN